MHIGIPKERLANEARVAATPQTVGQLLKLGFTVSVEQGAGHAAHFEDQAFIDAGRSEERRVGKEGTSRWWP